MAAHLPGLLQALELLAELGAEGTARRVRQRLRELGASGVPRGPRATTRANPALLTARQVEVVALLAAALFADSAARVTRSSRGSKTAIVPPGGRRDPQMHRKEPSGWGSRPEAAVREITWPRRHRFADRVYRSTAQMAAFPSVLPAAAVASSEVFLEPTGNVAFLEVVKNS